MAYDAVARLTELLAGVEIADEGSIVLSYTRGYEKLYYRKTATSGATITEGYVHPNGRCEYVAGIACRWCNEPPPAEQPNEGVMEHD